MTTHGYSAYKDREDGKRRGARTYEAWQHMKARCDNTSLEHAAHYSLKGVTYDPRWKFFENFLADMWECPTGMELDRFPHRDGNYEPGNCRWATKLQNIRNSRVTKLNEESVREIKRRIAAKPAKQTLSSLFHTLGVEYGVTRSAIFRIYYGATWSDVKV